MIDASNGEVRAAIGSGYGLVRAGDLRSPQPLGPPLVCPNDLPAIDFLILGKILRGSLLVGSPCTERFIERRLLSGCAILNRTVLHAQTDNPAPDLDHGSGGASGKRLFTALSIAERRARSAACPFRSSDDLAAYEVLSVGCAVGFDVGALLLALRVLFANGLLVASPDVVRIQLGKGGGRVIGVLPFSVYRACRSGEPSVDYFDRGYAVSFDSGNPSNPIGESVYFASFICGPSARNFA